MTDRDIAEKALNLSEGAMKNFDEIMKLIRDLIKEYPNDSDLGKVIREGFSKKNTDKN